MATPNLPLAWLLTAGGEQIVTAGGERVQVVTDPAQAHDRVRAIVLELDVDRCSLSFGVAPCVATGTKCYNSYATCKDKANFTRGVQTWRFALRGQVAPPGLQWRPYISDISTAPTEIRPTQGLAIRSQTTVTLVDETDADTEGDPYYTERTASGTFWGRFISRNPAVINRTARVRRGWWGAPFDFTWAVDETYIVDQVRGPGKDGAVSFVLTDPIKLADKAQLPAPTDGKLAAELKAVTFDGTLAGATATTAVLPAGASVEPTAYVGQEVYLVTGLGAGQRRVVSAYDPATFTVTVPAWDVTPGVATQFQIVPLSVALGSGQGAQYVGASHVRIGKEIIALSSVAGDTLHWSSGTSRGQFGSTAADSASANATVQRCMVFTDAAPMTVLTQLIEAAGVPSSMIDTAGFTAIETTWLRGTANITACLSSPTKVADLIKELSTDLALMIWYDPQAAKVKIQINLPNAPGSVASLTDDNFIAGSMSVERLDAERITQTAQFYGLTDATDPLDEPVNFARADVRIDTDAQGLNEYRDTRPDTRYSRWLTEANSIYVQATVARRLNALRDAPARFAFRLDPKDAAPIGELRDLSTRRYQGPDGLPLTVRARVTRVADAGTHRECLAQSTPFGGKRWAWIAPAGQPNYGSATAAQKDYAYIASAGGGNFADGGLPYRMI